MRLWHVLLLTLAFSPLLLGQSSSSITGQVTDQSKAAMPGVRIIVRAIDTGVEHRTTTNQDGYYTVAALLPVDYSVTAEMEGFKKTTSPAFKLDIASTARIDLVMVVNDARQVVEVTAAPPALETQTSMVGETVSRKELDSLPLEGRNTLELALTVPGISGEVGSDEGGIYVNAPVVGSGLSISGGRTGSSAILADGSNATGIGYGRATVTFSPDTIQEFKVITSTFSAQYGVSGGGVINTVSKSGTEQLKGSASWFTRNPALAARQFNRDIKPQLRRNEIGLTAGGPVVLPKLYNGRHKTFFFFSAEPKRYIDATDQYEHLPTAQERQGDFRNSWVAPGATRPLLYRQVECYPSESDCRKLNWLNRATNATVYPLFSENDPDPSKRGLVIPKAYLDPVAQTILKDVPMPNMPYNSSGQSYFGTRGVEGKDYRWNLKIDHSLGSRNRVTGRYSNIPALSDRYRLQKGNMFMSTSSDRSVTRQAFLSDSHTISARMVNEFRGSYTFSDYSRTAPGDLATVNYTTDLFGLPSQTGWGYPYFNSGFGSYGLSGSGNPLGQYIEHQFQFSDDLTMNFGRHTITTGTDWRFQQFNVKGTGLFQACCGVYNFAANLTQSGNANIPGGAGGLQFASFLLGVPSSADLRSIIIPYYYRYRAGAALFQDDFKFRPNLTLNLGMRWQYNSPRAEKYNRQAGVDLEHPVELKDASGHVTGYTLNYLYSGFGRSRYLEPAHRANFEPRVGFAWTPAFGWNSKRRVVIRGGYGISHASTSGRGRSPIPDFGYGGAGSWNYAQWIGNTTKPTAQAVDPNYMVSLGRNAPVVTGDPTVLQIPANGVLCAGCSPADPRAPSGALTAFAKTNKVPYVQTWNLTVQAELARRHVLSLSYLGQKGTHLYSPALNINNPDIGQYEALLDQGGDPAQTVPDPFGRVDSQGRIRTVALQDLMRLYPTLGDINVVGFTNGNSIYNAGTASIERRFSQGVGYRFNYSWAKSIDTNSDGSLDQWQLYIWGIGRVQNPLDLKNNRSVSLFDSRHRFNLTTTIDAPFGRGRRFLRNSRGLANQLAGGWSVNAVGSLYSGFPFAPNLGDPNGIPGGRSGSARVRPDMVPGVPIINPAWNKTVANDVPYFNPEAFGRPVFGQYGNAPRTLDYARNPWKPGLNMSVFREIRPFKNEKRYLQLRVEAFNLLNHATFTVNPNSSQEMFSAGNWVTRTGVQVAGPLPNLVGKTRNDFPVGSRENLLAANYQQGFGKFDRNNNGPGRIIQIALKIYW